MILSKSWKQHQSRNANKLLGTGLTKATDDSTIMRRAIVVEAMPKAGIPLSKVDHLRPLLEANNAKLTYSSHLAQIIFLLENERSKMKEEMKSPEHIVVIFDGTTHLGEALAIILLRFLNDFWEIQERLVRLRVLEKTMSGLELARELVSCLSTFLQVPAAKLVAFIRDGASVNVVVVNQVRQLLYTIAMDVICASHSLDNVGSAG